MIRQPGERGIRSIVVAGGGIVGLSAAIAFARALPAARVGLLDLPVAREALADRMPGTLPAVGRFHAALGTDEISLVRAGAAVHRLGTRFDQWSADGEPWVHGFGDYGVPLGRGDFHLYWAAARRRGQAAPFHRHASVAVLAEADRFVHPSAKDGSPLATFIYALRLDPLRYRRHLVGLAAQLPIERIEGLVAGIERRGDGGVGALALGDGRRLEADLYIDASGPAAILHASVSDGFDAWGGCLPADRLLLGEGRVEPPTPCDRVAATA